MVSASDIVAGGMGGRIAAPFIATGQGAKSVASWALALGITQDTLESVKDPGFWIFILSLPLYLPAVFASLLPEWLPVVSGVAVFFKVFFSSLFFIPLVVLFVQGGRGLFFTIAFVVWYLFLGAPLGGSTLLSLIVVYIFIMGFFAVLGKTRKIDVALPGLIVEDIVSALVPIVLFFIDVGFIDWLIRTFQLTFLGIIQGLLLYLPVWTLYGLWQTRKETALLTFLKMSSVVYVVFVLMWGVIPQVPQIAATLNAPGIVDIQKAKDAALQKMPQGENPFVSQVACTWTYVAQPQQIELCVKERQAESKCKQFKKKDMLDEENEDYQECLGKLKGDKKEVDVVGAIDPTITEFTKVDIAAVEGFPLELLSNTDSVPISFALVSPREQLSVEVACAFSLGDVEVEGIASPAQLVVPQGKVESTVLCTPSAELPVGQVKLTVTAYVKGLKTTSRLQRAFVGEKNEEDSAAIKLSFFPQSQATSLSAPEFVRLNFQIGDPPANPLVTARSNPLLIAVLENSGGGQIAALKNVEIMLVPGLRVVEEQRCSFMSNGEGNTLTRESFNIQKLDKKEKIPLGVCSLEMDENLRYPPSEFVVKDFSAVVEYDYTIQKQLSFTVPENEEKQLRVTD